MNLIGIDTGGTFTDFVFSEDGKLRMHKVVSTPRAPEEAIEKRHPGDQAGHTDAAVGSRRLVGARFLGGSAG